MDGRKGGKLAQRWLGPYRVKVVVGKGLYCPQQSEYSKKHSMNAGIPTVLFE